ncbi:MAG: RNA polymerase sigma factor [Myxococcaceae bacterium]
MEPADLEQEMAQLHPASSAWALACCGWDTTEAEEVLHSAYLRVLEGRAQFRGHSSLKTWLFAIVRTVAAETRRRRWFRDMALRRWVAGSPPRELDPTPDEALNSEERGARVRRALGQLAVRQREVLDLVFFHGQTIEEAAAVMGVALGTARVHYQRGKRRLLALLAPEETDEAGR